MNATIKYLTSLGHQYNPSFNGAYDNVDWSKVALSDEEGRRVLASFQKFMSPEHTEACNFIYGAEYEPVFDGVDGLATDITLKAQRCGCPDYYPSSYDATGTGSWATGCTQEWEQNHGYYYFLRGVPSRFEALWPEMLKIGKEAYAEIGFALVETKTKSKAHSDWYWTNLRPGIIGLASVPDRGSMSRCRTGSQFFMSMDNAYVVSAIMNATLLCHETAHNMGVGHISGDPVQHPGIRPGWNGSFLNTALGRVFKGMFGGEPLDPNTDLFGPQVTDFS